MTPQDRGRHLLDGTARSLLAEALFPLTGLVTASYLTRQLLPEGYGWFTLVASLVAWVEWTVTTLFSRAAIKLVGEAEDWRPVGATLVRWQLWIGLAAMVAVQATAGPVAALLGAPEIAPYLRLMALEIPVFAVAQAYRTITIGLGGYRQRAITSVWRWTSRLVFIIALVELGFSIPGAILGNVAAAFAELFVARYYCRVPWRSATPVPVRRLLDYAVPLFAATLCLRLFDVQILLLLKACGGSAADVGLVGAAANLAIVPRLFTLSFAPLLTATLTHLLRDNQTQKARDIGRDSLRLAWFLLPVAGLTAGAGDEVTRLIFGPGFEAAGGLLGWLMFAAVALVAMNIVAAILTAGGKPGRILWFAAPLLALGVAGSLWLIPRYLAEGAVIAMAGSAAAGVVIALVTVWRCERVGPALGSLARSAFLTVAGCAAAASWPTPGAWVVVKLAVLAALVAAGFFALREFTAREVALVRSLLPWNRSSPS